MKVEFFRGEENGQEKYFVVVNSVAVEPMLFTYTSHDSLEFLVKFLMGVVYEHYEKTHDHDARISFSVNENEIRWTETRLLRIHRLSEDEQEFVWNLLRRLTAEKESGGIQDKNAIRA